MWKVDVAREIRPYPSKDHDRIYAFRNSIFGLFDGAGNSEASDLAVATLSRMVLNPIRPFNVINAMTKIQSVLRRRFDGEHTTTGVLLHLHRSQDGAKEISYASAGDSSLYSYIGANLVRRTVSETIVYSTGNVDNRDFLGHPDHRLKEFGSFELDPKRASTILMMSDGITNNPHEGHTFEDDLALVLEHTTNPEETVRSVMQNTTQFDDASIIAIRVTPSRFQK